MQAGEHVFCRQEAQSKIQQERKSGKWLKEEIIAVQGSMAVVNTGATMFQANTSKLRRPLETVDLEELPDSREEAGAPVLWPSCEGQIDVWEMFSDNSYFSAVLDRQGLQVAAPIDLRTKKAESSSPQLITGLLAKAQEKESQDCWDVTEFRDEKLQKERSGMATVQFVYGRGRTSKFWRKTFPYFGTRIRKYFGG